jgi:cardiolipin synthase
MPIARSVSPIVDFGGLDLGLETAWLLGLFGRVRADILAPIGFALAILCTGHILLRKRDVGAAIGWIGFAWLSPIFGSAMYFTFGINRVERRARRMRPTRRRGERESGEPGSEIPPHLVALERATRRLTGLTAEAGNAVAMFVDGDNAYPVMLAAIGAARTSIALSTYIMRNDDAGQRFSDALAAAKERGVEVRVLIDGIGSGYFHSGIYNRMTRAGLTVARFMHSSLPWRMPFLNLRSHKKILVVDGRIGFTGGINIAEENMLSHNPPEPVRDTHFRFEGPVVAQLMAGFAQDWSFTTGEGLEGPTWFPPLEAAGEAVARVVTSGPDEDLEKIAYVLLEAVSCARSSVTLMTPYFLPDDRLVTALAMAAIRGIAVDIIVPERSDHRLIDYAFHAHVEPLLGTGARIWRNPPPFEHSKLLLIDKAWCFVGSANWDMRSLRLNFELNVEVYNDDLAREIDEMMRTRMVHRLTRKDLAARGLPVRLRDALIRLFLPYL